MHHSKYSTLHSAKNTSNELFIKKLLARWSPNKSVCLPVKCVLTSMFFMCILTVCLLLYLFTQGLSQQHEKWTAILEQMVFFMSGKLGDFQPDKGHDRAGQSLSSCFGDTFEPTHCQGGDHSEQSHGRRSFHCTSCPGPLKSIGNTVQESTVKSK